VNGLTSHRRIIWIGPFLCTLPNYIRSQSVGADAQDSLFMQPVPSVKLSSLTVIDGVALLNQTTTHVAFAIDGHTVYLPTKSGIVPFLQDREHGALWISRSRVDLCQTPNELVEGRAKAVEKVAKYERNIIGDVSNLYPYDMKLIFKVIFSEEFAGFVAESSESFPEVFKMYLRPGCFEVGIGHVHVKHKGTF
jgi:hypothetical protein